MLMCTVSLQERYIACSASQTSNGNPAFPFLLGSGSLEWISMWAPKLACLLSSRFSQLQAMWHQTSYLISSSPSLLISKVVGNKLNNSYETLHLFHGLRDSYSFLSYQCRAFCRMSFAWCTLFRTLM